MGKKHDVGLKTTEGLVRHFDVSGDGPWQLTIERGVVLLMAPGREWQIIPGPGDTMHVRTTRL